MSDIEKKIDGMYGMLHEMRPMLSDVRDGQKSMETRVRAVEQQGGVHAVKIDRIQSDLDGLGRKLRHVVVAPREDRGKFWTAVLEFLAVVPTYWHVVLSATMLIASVITILWRHRP